MRASIMQALLQSSWHARERTEPAYVKYVRHRLRSSHRYLSVIVG